MATRSRIGIQLSDESVLSVYCHWDGYPSGVGQTLVEDYDTNEKVTELIDGGDMSSCCSKDNQPEYYSAHGEDCPPRLDANKYDYLAEGEQYAYLFVDGKWVCYDRHQFEENTMPTIAEIPVPTAT